LKISFSKKPTKRISLIESTLTKASTWCLIIGSPAIGKSGFGNDKDNGLNLVPTDGPPTKIIAYL